MHGAIERLVGGHACRARLLDQRDEEGVMDGPVMGLGDLEAAAESRIGGLDVQGDREQVLQVLLRVDR